eukprot:CAMPEP_0184297726 /NCGR_PEP_ID=MMETSP1049-20130417/8613_1 /TAXON_ID=77928 /ORGANISM="Proteomonas sulcata, Strain CCMP704" /LENGTH=312 /DNA_ID=CAMNT_0026607581 /DNA_START=131 /DNA_END=1069 /DNA_ORIENTATION=+
MRTKGSEYAGPEQEIQDRLKHPRDDETRSLESVHAVKTPAEARLDDAARSSGIVCPKEGMNIDSQEPQDHSKKATSRPVQQPQEMLQLMHKEQQAPEDSDSLPLGLPEHLRADTLSLLDSLDNVEREEEYISKGLHRSKSCSLARERRSELEIRLDPKVIQVAIQDWKHCGQSQKTYKLPASVSASSVLEDYAKWHRKQATPSPFSAVSAAQREIFVAEIKVCFDKVLESLLLYEAAELEQFQKLKSAQPDMHSISWTSVYGALHLVRLLLRLPECSALMEGDRSRRALANMTHDLLEYMATEVSLDPEKHK